MKATHHTILSLVLVLPFCFAWGHAVVYPERVAPGNFEKFTLRVPSEKPIATTEVRLLIPRNLRVFNLGSKQGWRYRIEKDTSGRINSITWSEGAIPAAEFTDFEFVARAPVEPGTLVWKAYQTYQDGSVVAWVGAPDAREPASITRIERPPAMRNAPAWASWGALILAVVSVLLSGYSLVRHG